MDPEDVGQRLDTTTATSAPQQDKALQLRCGACQNLINVARGVVAELFKVRKYRCPFCASCQAVASLPPHLAGMVTQGQEAPSISACLESSGSPQGAPQSPACKRRKVLHFQGREANPRRVRIWRERAANKRLFDVVLKAKDREVASNRLLLAEESEFFERRFSAEDFAGSDAQVELPDIDGDTLQVAVTSLLTAHIFLHDDILEPVLHCADMLQLGIVKQACCQYLEESLSEESVVPTLRLADKHHLARVRAAALDFVAAHFYLFHRTALNTLDKATLCEILSRDDLIVFSEMQVIRAISSWVETNDGTAQYAQLFGLIRLEHMETFEIRSLQLHKQCPDLPALVELLLQRIEGLPLISEVVRRDQRRYIWTIDKWSLRYHTGRARISSPDFRLAGSRHRWALSWDSDTEGLYLDCLSGPNQAEEVQLTLVLYDQSDYNKLRRWRLPPCVLEPGERQGYKNFFDDIDDFVMKDRVVVGVQLRMVCKWISNEDILSPDRA